MCSKIYDQLCEGRKIEAGFLCENPNCHEPIEDSRPLVEDWRVPKGRTKRLCAACAEIEDDASDCECPDEGHLSGCFHGEPTVENIDTIGPRTVEKLNKCSEAWSDIDTLFTKMFRAESGSPKAKMKRYWKEYK